jgi:hypothetical protein
VTRDWRLPPPSYQIPHPALTSPAASLVTPPLHAMAKPGKRPPTRADFHAAHSRLHSKGRRFDPVAFHWATLSVSESYIVSLIRSWTRDLSLTRDFGHLILGTRPGRGRRSRVSRRVVYAFPSNNAGCHSTHSHADPGLWPKGRRAASRSKLAVIAGPRLWRTYP